MADPKWKGAPIVEPQPRGKPWEKYRQQSEQAGNQTWREAPIVASKRAGMFDDLIPSNQRGNTPTGMFDDLIPSEPTVEDDSSLATIIDGAETALNTTGYWAEAAVKTLVGAAGAPVDLLNMSPMLGNLLPGEQGIDPAKAADELLQFAGGDPQAIEGAKSAFWKLMERDAKSNGVTTRSSGGEQSWRPQSLYNFLKDPKKRAVMERL